MRTCLSKILIAVLAVSVALPFSLSQAEAPSPKASPKAGKASRFARTVVERETTRQGAFIVIKITVPDNAKTEVFSVPNPHRIVVDFPATKARKSEPFTILKNDTVANVRFGSHREKMRVVIDLVKDKVPTFAINSSAKQVTVRVAEGDFVAAATPTATSVATTRPTTPPLSPTPASTPSKPTQTAPTPQATKQAQVTQSGPAQVAPTRPQPTNPPPTFTAGTVARQAVATQPAVTPSPTNTAARTPTPPPTATSATRATSTPLSTTTPPLAPPLLPSAAPTTSSSPVAGAEVRSQGLTPTPPMKGTATVLPPRIAPSLPTPNAPTPVSAKAATSESTDVRTPQPTPTQNARGAAVEEAAAVFGPEATGTILFATPAPVTDFHLVNYRFDFLEPGRIPVLKILLDKSRPQAQISKVDPKTYTIEILNCSLSKPGLALPQYPPAEFKGFVLISSTSNGSRLTITINVDAGTTLGTFVRNNEIWIKRL